MYRVSVTTIEAFRRYMAGVSQYDTEEKLIEAIKGEFAGNEYTVIGQAYHKIIEGDFQVIGGDILAAGVIMTKEQATPAAFYAYGHPDALHETKASKVYDTPRFGPIQLRGKIDISEGLQVRDAKVKFSRPTVTEYVDSCQGKFYLDIMEADTFFYDVFEFKYFDGLKKVANGRRLPPKVKVVPHDPIAAHRYTGMADDLDRILHQFLDYCDLRQLFPYLKNAIDEVSFL